MVTKRTKRGPSRGGQETRGPPDSEETARDRKKTNDEGEEREATGKTCGCWVERRGRKEREQREDERRKCKGCVKTIRILETDEERYPTD